MARTSEDRKRLNALLAVFEGHASMVIVLQDNPDPDALASAMALRTLANTRSVACSIAYSGTIGRAENRALVRYTRLNLRPLDELNLERYDLIAMVDTQPGQANNSLPEGVFPQIVIDHHPRTPESAQAAFADIRSNVGATSTILVEYLQAAEIQPEPPLATALLYGIRSDTQDFQRQGTQADIDAYAVLFPLANKRMLGGIQRGQAPPEYFQTLSAALLRARRCGRSIFCPLGTLDNPDMVAEVADLLLRHENADWSLCWAVFGRQILLSVRTLSNDPPAVAVAQAVVAQIGSGGGHAHMAGGQIPLTTGRPAELRRLDGHIRRAFLAATGQQSHSCRRLASPPRSAGGSRR